MNLLMQVKQLEKNKFDVPDKPEEFCRSGNQLFCYYRGVHIIEFLYHMLFITIVRDHAQLCHKD